MQNLRKWGSYLHDIGKSWYSDAVPFKSGVYTPRVGKRSTSLLARRFVTLQTMGVIPPSAIITSADGRLPCDQQVAIPKNFQLRYFRLLIFYDALTSERPHIVDFCMSIAVMYWRNSVCNPADPAIY